MNRFLRRLLAVMIALAGAGIAGVAVFVGAYYYVEPSLPDVEELRDVSFQTPLRIYSRDGRLISQFGGQKRRPVDFEEIPDQLVNAFIAAEDDRFFEHPGIDFAGIVRAAYGLLSGQDLGGGSTITQQVAREYFLSREFSLARKFKEQIIALRIEREFSKQKIMELFCNTFFLGQQSFGVAAAAQTYFGKALDELTLSEIAVIAGIPNGPSIMNPVYSVENARQRRDYVLGRMAAVGFITEAERREALAEPIVSRLHGLQIELEAPYVAEMVRLEMIRRFGQEAAYTAGLKVTTTVDSRLQRAANRSVRSTLIAYDERHGYRGPVAQVDLDAADGAGDAAAADDAQGGAQDAAGWNELLAEYPGFGFEVGIVLEATETDARVHVRGLGERTIGLEAVGWAAPYLSVNAVGARPGSVDEVLERGDIVRFRHTADGGLRLGQLPEVQGAFVALDPADGAIAALVGGYDYVLSNFNSATQALRQPGSSFKPFLYSAALEHGYTAASLVNDSPVTIWSEDLEAYWQPENYSGVSHGLTRLREALVHSYNQAAIRTLRDVGPADAIAHMRRFGYKSPALPRNLALALGAGGVAPVDLATGFAVFANGGYRVEHYFIDRIEDADGNRLYPSESMPARPAFVCRPAAHAEAELPEGIAASVAIETPAAPCADEAPAGSEPARGQPSLAADAAALYPEIGRAERVIDAQNAYLVADMMRDVAQRGSGRSAYRELKRNDLAGKTGTTNDRRDAWFSGFNRDIVASGWVGFLDNRPLGTNEQGGFTAIPMWIEFMREALKGQPERWLEQPPGIVEVRVDRSTGRAVCGARPNTMFEKFRIEHVPERDCGDSLESTPSEGSSSERIF